MAKREQDLTGTTLGERYQLIALLAAGDTSTLYMAQDDKLGSRVAVRVPSEAASSREGFGDAFQESARALSGLSHDGLVRLQDFGVDGDTPFAVVQNVTGGTLAQRVKDFGGKLAPQEIAQWLPVVAEALDQLHAQGLSHGGVALDSLLCDAAPSTRVFLADPVVRSALRAVSGAQPAGLEAPGPADDQHGLASAIYEALGGTLPWTGKDDAQARSIRAKRTAKPIKGLSDGLNEALLRALDLDPEGRFSKCTSFARSFAEAAAEAPAPAAAPSGPMQTASDSETLAFGRARPAAPAAPTAGAPAAEDHGATKPITMRRGSKGIPGGVVLVLFLLLVAVAIAALVASRKKDKKETTVATDETAPVMTIITPTDRMVTKESEIPVEGSVDDTEAIVLIGGNPVLVDSDGVFKTKVRLPKEGEQAVKLEARDNARNESRVQVIVIRDSTPPTFEIFAPTPEVASTPTTQTHVKVQGRTGDPTDKVTVAGEPVDVAEDGVFEVDVEIPKNGANPIEIVSTDAVGNESKQTVVAQRRLVVCCDTLEIKSPGDGFTTREDKVLVRGRMEDPLAKVFVDGKEVALSPEGFFQGMAALPEEGTRDVEVTAVGAAGQKGKKTVKVRRDLTPPTITLDGPPPKPGVVPHVSAGEKDFSGTIDDDANCKVSVNGFLADVTEGKWMAKVPLSPGAFQIVVEAWDDAGNRAEPIVRRVEVPRPSIKHMKYKGRNKAGYHQYVLRADPTVELVLIPGAGYVRGAIEGDKDAEDHERPDHRVNLSPFLITTGEITWEQFKKFSTATDYQFPRDVMPEDYLRSHPAVNVTYDDARAYCQWADLSLPTEGEWERAARGGVRQIWPWGDTFNGEACNAESSRGKTAPAGSYAATGVFELFDIAGNAAEWCQDWYGQTAYAELAKNDPQGPGSGTERVVRGGSWKDEAKNTRISARRGVKPDTRNEDVGFRAVYRLPEK